MFSSYLSERHALTVIDGHKSDVLPLLAGVPQGSKLGPLLYIIFMNDIVADLESTPFLYADDTTLIATASSTYQTTNILNRDLGTSSEKKTVLCGNISHTRWGGLTHSHLFMFVLPSFFLACQNHPEVLKNMYYYFKKFSFRDIFRKKRYLVEKIPILGEGGRGSAHVGIFPT